MMEISIAVVIVAIIAMVAQKHNATPHTYNAEFGEPSDQLSRWNYGFAVTGSKALTKKVSHENCALFGPTGSGKSTIVIISSAVSLARAKSSMIFNDVSGEVYERTSAYLAIKGYKILRLDFSDSTNSETFNPLARCSTISDIQKVSLMIVRNSIGESKGDAFWEQSSTMLLSLFSRYLVFHTEPRFRTLQNVLRLIETFAVDGPKIDKLFVQTEDEELSDALQPGRTGR